MYGKTKMKTGGMNNPNAKASVKPTSAKMKKGGAKMTMMKKMGKKK